jgi:hypothetical protein
MLEDEYKRWLEKEGYQPTTIATSIASTRSAEKKWSGMAKELGTLGPLTPRALTFYTSLLKRYSRFLHSIPFPRWSAWERFVVDNFEAATPQKPRGASAKPELTQKQWQSLVASVGALEEPADGVLCLILGHLPELEPRAILKMEVRSFAPTFSTALALIKKKRVRFLWSYISATPVGAYAKVKRQLLKRTEELGFEADFFSLARAAAEARAKAKVA